jgi:signal transduction histidine kinase
VLARPVGEVLGLGGDHVVVDLVKRALSGGGGRGRPLAVDIHGSSLRVTVAGIAGQDGQATALVIARDVSDLKAAEQARAALDAQLAEASKMSSLGRMVAGVAHEINNPLAAMLPNVKALDELIGDLAGAIPTTRREPALESFLREGPAIAAEVLEAGERIRSIVAEMRSFSYPDKSTGELVTLQEILEPPLALAATSLRPKATIERVYGDTPKIVVDRARMAQAVLNILVNAAQAIEGHDPTANRVRVETRSDDAGVTIDISNSGPPIPDDVLPKIFEPFFTTKAVGEGVGLGLSITYDTIRSHGGNIEVLSRPGLTTFRIWLPHDTGRSVPTPRPAAVAPSVTTARVLVVDDDRLVRSSLRRSLERQHDVTLASSGERALELLSEKSFDVILCDLVMPQMSGMELYSSVKARSPEQAARFVFLTGGTHSPEAREFLQTVPNPRAYKPVSPEELTAMVARALYERGRAPG